MQRPASNSEARKRDLLDEIGQQILEKAAADWCGHLSSDITGNCMTCAREEKRHEDMAHAWDEGYGAFDAWNGEVDTEPENPYRAGGAP